MTATHSGCSALPVAGVLDPRLRKLEARALVAGLVSLRARHPMAEGWPSTASAFGAAISLCDS